MILLFRNRIETFFTFKYNIFRSYNQFKRRINMDKKIRIAIIGGGPAGLSAAMYLEKKGYENYVIYEKQDHVGGKCHSPYCNGKRYEMGAIMGVPSYYAVHDVELFAGVTHDGPALNRNYKYPDGKIDSRWDTHSAQASPLKYFLKHPKNALHLKKLAKQIKEFGQILETKYKGYDICGHLGVSEGRYKGYAVAEDRHPVEGVNPNLKDLAMPFKDFCEMNGVPLVQEVWVQPFTSFGYGYFDEIPAAYVLKYLDFQTMMNFVQVNLWTWKDGTQSIYEALNKKLKNPAVLNANVEKVVRTEKNVTITVNGKEEVFDKIIVTAPLQVATEKNPLDNPVSKSLDTWFDVRDNERELFSKIDYERYDTEAFIVEKDKYPDNSYYIVDNMVPEKLGHVMVYYRRWKNEPDQPIVSYVLRHHKTAFGGKELNYDEVCKNVIEDMRKAGSPIEVKDGKENIIYKFQTYYFPHIYSEDYQAGWYEKVEALQGELNTYYAGEIMSFGDMDETIEYSHDLIERFF